MNEHFLSNRTLEIYCKKEIIEKWSCINERDKKLS